MEMKKISFLLVLWGLLGSSVLSAQEERSETFVDFRVNTTYIDPDYGDNAQRLAQITEFLRNMQNDSTVSLLSVSFCGTASPEGSYQLNKRLARGRLESLESAVRTKVSIPDSIISRIDEYIPWEYLSSMVAFSDLSHREEILMIINSEYRIVDYHSGQQIDDRILRLQQLDGGRAWKELNDRFFSRMRNASVVFVTYRKEIPAALAPVVLPKVEEPDSAPSVEPAPAPAPVPVPVLEKRPFYMAVNTNLLYDVLLIPNVGVEFYLGKDWSVAGNWQYAWWSNDRKHNYWRVYGGDIALRKWFGSKAKEKPLTGHHLGIYLQALTYDFERGGRGYMGGEPGGNIFERANYAAGIEYGYSHPIGRRLNLDFTLGVGYGWGKYYEYLPMDDCYVWQTTKNRRWFGPTKAEVSLVWLLGRGNENKKGGNR